MTLVMVQIQQRTMVLRKSITADTSCCASCVEPSRPQQWGPNLPFFGHAGRAELGMAGAAAHKYG